MAEAFVGLELNLNYYGPLSHGLRRDDLQFLKRLQAGSGVSGATLKLAYLNPDVLLQLVYAD